MMRDPVAKPSQAVEALIQAALEGGGRENVSVIVALCPEEDTIS
jgi:serine/threonine protein phosphatase PrpC